MRWVLNTFWNHLIPGPRTFQPFDHVSGWILWQPPQTVTVWLFCRCRLVTSLAPQILGCFHCCKIRICQSQSIWYLVIALPISLLRQGFTFDSLVTLRAFILFVCVLWHPPPSPTGALLPFFRFYKFMCYLVGVPIGRNLPLFFVLPGSMLASHLEIIVMRRLLMLWRVRRITIHPSCVSISHAHSPYRSIHGHVLFSVSINGPLHSACIISLSLSRSNQGWG